MPYHFLFTEWFDRNLKFLRKHNPSTDGFLHFVQNLAGLNQRLQAKVIRIRQAILVAVRPELKLRAGMAAPQRSTTAV